MVRTKSSMSASCSGEAWTTRSGPSSTMVRSSSVMRLAISTMVWRAGSSPVISRSIQASMRGHATGRSQGRPRLRRPCNVRRCCASPCTSSTPSCPCPATRGRGTPAPTWSPGPTPCSPAGAGGPWCRRGWPSPSRPGYAGLVLPRSGLAARHGITCLNAPGLIDSGYRGELQVVLVNHDPEHDYAVSRGDRIAQLVLVRVEQAAFELGGRRGARGVRSGGRRLRAHRHMTASEGRG